MTASKTWVTKKLHFAFHKGRFERRSVSAPTVEGESRWEQIEF